jgi:acyl-CoA synthetase (AMP-forming)/AMP-acid ligase II
MILGEFFERNERCFGSKPALIFEGRTITHREFAQRVRRLVNSLAYKGLQKQDRLAVLSRNCPEYLEVYGAAGLGGFIGVGVNYRLSLPEQADVMEDAAPSAVFFEAEYEARVDELRAKLPATTLYVAFDKVSASAAAWSVPYETLLSQASDATPAIRATEDDTLLLIYTSGTTGRAKGVMLGNGAQVAQARGQALTHAANPDGRMLIVMPFYHIGGPTELLTFTSVGATVVLHRMFDAVKILTSIQEHQVTCAHLAPTMIQMMLDVQEKTPYDVSSLATIVYASAPMSVALSLRARSVFGPIFMQVYGMTELGLGTTLLKHQHLLEGTPAEVKRLASAGQPYIDTVIDIVRADGTRCAAGEIGEIWMTSPSVMQGYWNRPELTFDAMGTGLLKTGDVGYFDDEQFLFIVDRKKDMIVSGGENIYSREVEESLLLHPAVAEASVIGVPDDKWGESVMAFVVLRPGMSLSFDEAVAHCRTMIASYKKPRYLKIIDAMPRVPSTNKIDKRALREPFWAGAGRQVA